VFELAVQLSAIMFPALIFLVLANLASGYLQSNNRFAASAVTSIPFNLFIIGSVLLPFNRSVQILAVGSLIGIASQYFVQLPAMIRAGYKISPVIFDFKEEGFRRLMMLSMPVVLGSIFNHLSSIIGKVLASGLNEGSISALDYAGRITGNINSIFMLSVVTVAFPELSKLFDDHVSFISTVTKIMRIIIFISVPAVTGIFVLRTPAVKFLFERGQFNAQDTYVTSIALGCLSLGIIWTGIEALLVKAFYALKDTKTPVINGVLGVIINIVLSLIFVRVWEIAGLALAVSLSSMIKCFALLFKFKRKIAIFKLKPLVSLCVKASAGSLLMGVFIYAFNNIYYTYLPGQLSFIYNAAGLMLNVILGAAIYLAAMYVLKSEEIGYFGLMIKNKLGLK